MVSRLPVAGRTPAARCAAHPARPAVDACPTCGRPRCGADAKTFGAGCAACPTQQRPQPTPRSESLVRAALAALPMCLAGGAVSSEYVGTTAFDVIVPFLVGVAVGAVAVAAAGRPEPRTRLLVRAVAVLYAVVGAAYGYRLVVGGQDPFGPFTDVAPAYAAAAAGAWLWTMPSRRRRPSPAEGDQDGRGSRVK